MERKQILVVEDDFLIRMTLAEALADEGFDVLEAGTADEALIHLRDNDAVGLLMTDIQLPGGMDGRELGRQVRASHPDLPMIFMTGRPDPDAVPTAREIFINKPYLPSELCAAAKRMMQDTAN